MAATDAAGSRPIDEELAESVASHVAELGTPVPMGDIELNSEIVEAMKCTSFQDVCTRLDRMTGLSEAINSQATTEEDTQERRFHFQKDVSQLRKRMKDARRGFINPRSGYIQQWDLVTAIALLCKDLCSINCRTVSANPVAS